MALSVLWLVWSWVRVQPDLHHSNYALLKKKPLKLFKSSRLHQHTIRIWVGVSGNEITLRQGQDLSEALKLTKRFTLLCQSGSLWLFGVLHGLPGLSGCRFSGASHRSEWQKTKQYFTAIKSLKAFLHVEVRKPGLLWAAWVSLSICRLWDSFQAQRHVDEAVYQPTNNGIESVVCVNVCCLTGSFLCLLNAASAEFTVDRLAVQR